MSDGTRLGDLNGWWAFLSKIAIAGFMPTVGAIGLWGSWLTIHTVKAQQFMEQGPRYTNTHAELEAARLEAKLRKEILDHDQKRGDELHIIALELAAIREQLRRLDK